MYQLAHLSEHLCRNYTALFYYSLVSVGGVYCSTWRVFSECIVFAELHCQFFLGNDYCNEIVIPAHRFVACQREHVQCMVVQWCFLFWQCGLQRWQCHQDRLVSQGLGKENKPVNTSFSGICLKAAGRKLFFFLQGSSWFSWMLFCHPYFNAVFNRCTA